MCLVGFNGSGGTFPVTTLTSAAKATGIIVVCARAPIPLKATNLASCAQDFVWSAANSVHMITASS